MSGYWCGEKSLDMELYVCGRAEAVFAKDKAHPSFECVLRGKSLRTRSMHELRRGEVDAPFASKSDMKRALTEELVRRHGIQATQHSFRPGRVPERNERHRQCSRPLRGPSAP
jgi:hypothetical protein